MTSAAMLASNYFNIRIQTPQLIYQSPRKTKPSMGAFHLFQEVPMFVISQMGAHHPTMTQTHKSPVRQLRRQRHRKVISTSKILLLIKMSYLSLLLLNTIVYHLPYINSFKQQVLCYDYCSLYLVYIQGKSLIILAQT